MSLDKEHIRRLLHEVAATKGWASARKAQELLDYVTGNTAPEKNAPAHPRPELADLEAQPSVH